MKHGRWEKILKLVMPVLLMTLLPCHAQLLIKNSLQNECMRVTQERSVGIGTTNPLGKTAVEGSVYGMMPYWSQNQYTSLYVNETSLSSTQTGIIAGVQSILQTTGAENIDAGRAAVVGSLLYPGKSNIVAGGSLGVLQGDIPTSEQDKFVAGLRGSVYNSAEAPPPDGYRTMSLFLINQRTTDLDFAIFSSNDRKSYLSGNLGIGTTHPTSLFGSTKMIEISDTGSPGLVFHRYDTELENDFYLEAGINSENYSYIGTPINTGLLIKTYNTERVRFTATGRVGIGTSSPGYLLQVGYPGDGGSEARANAWNTLSDVKYKEDINPIQDPVEKVKQLNGVTYRWKSNGKKSLGFIAQDVRKVVPEAVSEDEWGDLSMNYDQINALLVEAVKKQQAEIESLKKELKSLQRK